MEIIGISFLTAVAFFILMWKINLEFFAKYHWQADLIISSGLTFLFFGTFAGMVTALVSGIFISIFLFVSRLIIQPV
jgi:hypothetical protein